MTASGRTDSGYMTALRCGSRGHQVAAENEMPVAEIRQRPQPYAHYSRDSLQRNIILK